MAARSRPMSAAGGTDGTDALERPARASAGNRFDPSTMSRRVSVSGSWELGTIRESYAPSGPRLRSGA
jgi:hypothetical protein